MATNKLKVSQKGIIPKGQKRFKDCSHFGAEWDTHEACASCRGTVCSSSHPCTFCCRWDTSLWDRFRDSRKRAMSRLDKRKQKATDSDLPDAEANFADGGDDDVPSRSESTGKDRRSDQDASHPPTKCGNSSSASSITAQGKKGVDRSMTGDTPSTGTGSAGKPGTTDKISQKQPTGSAGKVK